MGNTKVDTKKMAICLGALVLVIIVIALIAGGGKKEVAKPDANVPAESNVITSDKLAEKKQYGELEIANVKFETEDKMTEVTADVINNTGSDVERQYVNINILDKNGEKITDITGFIEEVEAGGTGKMKGSFLTSEATNNAYNVEITRKQEQTPKASSTTNE